jgi:hypothetical protein
MRDPDARLSQSQTIRRRNALSDCSWKTICGASLVTFSVMSRVLSVFDPLCPNSLNPGVSQFTRTCILEEFAYLHLQQRIKTCTRPACTYSIVLEFVRTIPPVTTRAGAAVPGTTAAVVAADGATTARSATAENLCACLASQARTSKSASVGGPTK